MNKTEVKKLLVAERKSMREKQKQSKFMQRTLNIFNGMVRRAAEHKQQLDFTLVQFRVFVQVQPKQCIYCFSDVTPSTLTIEHYDPISAGGSFSLKNCYLSCKSCNWQKGGVMKGSEFNDLVHFMKSLRPEVAADIKRRLTIGGKWGVRA